ncbi:hypothetical protein BJY52DRAFT_1214213 [Lactarius psammicola]|nr:hypothetical protein BJY52DRAFT_1214213 [Lactarius psammicola]
MSARQPFLPSRPASRTVNRGDDANVTSGGNAVRAALPNPPSDANDSTELGKPTRALNIAGFKKSVSRATGFGVAVTGPREFETAQNQNPTPAKGAAARIYAPHPSTPPVIPPLSGFPTPEFKTPSLPFSRSTEEVPAGTGSRGPNNAHISPATADAVTNLFRPKSCRPAQGETGAQTTRRPPSRSSERSFFGNAKFPFDSSVVVGSSDNLDDSGYFSEHADMEVDRFGPVKKRNDHVISDPRSADLDTRFVNSTKRGRPASPGNDEDLVMVQQSNRPRDLPKRPCVHRPSSLSRTASMPDEGAPAFVLPPHIPHPMAAMGELPGLEFSEADLGRYAELYEQGSERWSKAPMEEWVAGADDVLAKFGEMIDMIKDHMSSKMNLYKSLHTRLSDEHSALEQRAKELRGASQTLVRDSGAIGGTFDSHEIDARAH